MHGHLRDCLHLTPQGPKRRAGDGAAAHGRDHPQCRARRFGKDLRQRCRDGQHPPGRIALQSHTAIWLVASGVGHGPGHGQPSVFYVTPLYAQCLFAAQATIQAQAYKRRDTLVWQLAHGLHKGGCIRLAQARHFLRLRLRRDGQPFGGVPQHQAIQAGGLAQLAQGQAHLTLQALGLIGHTAQDCLAMQRPKISHLQRADLRQDVQRKGALIHPHGVRPQVALIGLQPQRRPLGHGGGVPHLQAGAVLIPGKVLCTLQLSQRSAVHSTGSAAGQQQLALVAAICSLFH